ncbi:putative YigZ family protein [Mobilisporobacter senegalensis]|uniref:Putative YigZ family protein n=1 Tax=Mobilisporobacter senegalensis TaxID=1329262 RepID=A0A3N1XUP9_9FIRM|nr:YigZ family protein [Mobilisporobacter senegalensis]ROR30355.1 putative YigZ family protein [Mobilisporobacter senegalensis]
MKEEYKVIYQGSESEISEKKSRFIASIGPVDSEEDANIFIEKIKKNHWNATHNCFAYTIGMNHELTRCSDDGEPSGTAGKPMLDILLGEDIHNIVVVVTRYFGGTLLGTGGLIRAYQGAVKEGLTHALIVNKMLGNKLLICTNYNEIGKLQYISSQMELYILDTDYADMVHVTLLVPDNKLTAFIKKWTTVTNGKEQITNQGKVYFTIVEKEVIVFDLQEATSKTI